MIKKSMWALLITAILILFQSLLSPYIAIKTVSPDLALCILLYMALHNGIMTGQVLGFFSGLLLDVLSLAPLGLNSVTRILIGAFSGLFVGMFFIDFFLVPFFASAIAVILKALVFSLLSLLFGIQGLSVSFVTATFWIEVLYTALVAPFIFGLLNLFKPILVGGGKRR